MKKLTLKSKREGSILRLHPWVFSGGVAQEDDDIKDGDLVEVFSSRGDYLATGHYQDASIKVRIISFEQTEIDQHFWNKKIADAKEVRSQIGFPKLSSDESQPDNGSTNCYRLIHAEGDGCPGLIIDVFAETAIVQCHSIGMHRQIAEITTALKTAFGEDLKCIYDKSKKALPGNYARTMEDGALFGEVAEEVAVLENGHSFLINYQTGQKTGFFLDQRDNRAFVGQYAKGKTVLNAFCYTGGFSIYALKAGAELVHSVDASEKAINLCKSNVIENTPDIENTPELVEKHEGYVADVNRFFKDTETTYDLIVLDPPAFAKSISKRHNAVKGYKRLNAEAIRRIAPGGILFTFSCSQVIDRTLFQSTILAAAIEAGRQVRILHHLSQPPDHPVSLFHPEGSYLKGLVLKVT
ncbi:MAG: class I SAM-dependent rRNA methyltransferase [Saprospiraceae bacterium]